QWLQFVAAAGIIGKARKAFLPPALRRFGATADVLPAVNASRASHLSDATALPPGARYALRLLAILPPSPTQYIDRWRGRANVACPAQFMFDYHVYLLY